MRIAVIAFVFLFPRLGVVVAGSTGVIGSAVTRHTIDNTQGSVVSLNKLTCVDNLESLMQTNNSKRYAFEQVDICACVELEYLGDDGSLHRRHNQNYQRAQLDIRLKLHNLQRKNIPCYLESEQCCKSVQDGSYQRERLGTIQ